MGYNEVFCQLCTVSFNIARCKTEHEPQSASWGYTGGEYYSGNAWSSRCTPAKSGSGCKTTFTGPNNEIHLAGSGCCYTGGYSGHRITVEEMKVDMDIQIFIVFGVLAIIRGSLERKS